MTLQNSVFTKELLAPFSPASPLPLRQLSRKTSEEIGTVSIDPARWADRLFPDGEGKAVPGLYIFWWKINGEVALPEEDAGHYVKGKQVSQKDPDPLPEGVEKRLGKNGKREHLYYRTQWTFHRYDLSDGTYVPLYVGKTSDILSRVKQHLSWHQRGIDHYSSSDTVFDEVPITKFTTFQQFSAAFHYLFRNHADIAQAAKLDHVCLSVQPTDFAAFEERFYREDLLIGYLRPPFNMDSER